MFGDFDWPLNASRGLSAIAEFLVPTKDGQSEASGGITKLFLCSYELLLLSTGINLNQLCWSRHKRRRNPLTGTNIASINFCACILPVYKFFYHSSNLAYAHVHHVPTGTQNVLTADITVSVLNVGIFITGMVRIIRVDKYIHSIRNEKRFPSICVLSVRKWF